MFISRSDTEVGIIDTGIQRGNNAKVFPEEKKRCDSPCHKAEACDPLRDPGACAKR